MMPRVTSVTAILAMLLLAAPLPVEAQPAKMLPRVAVLYPGSPVQHDKLAAAFVQGSRR